VENIKKTQFIDEIKIQWKSMWHNRLDDKVCAEGTADKDYSLLDIERGTIIIATRKYKPPDLYELIQQHKTLISTETLPSHPSTGGWRKFIKTNLTTKKRTKRSEKLSQETNKHNNQQLKKNGKGWLHLKNKTS